MSSLQAFSHQAETVGFKWCLNPLRTHIVLHSAKRELAQQVQLYICIFPKSPAVITLHRVIGSCPINSVAFTCPKDLQ
ncbi:hypothetical protein XENTR_v10004835 [Xenopus tropicalis]|nr:hypothetical protein XENTR_v10004835 [Xenopus tropicalis]